MSDHHAAPSGEKASLLSNILAIIGLIILVIIIVWGLVHVAQLGSSWFTSLFQGSGPSITVNAPKDATSGAPVTVSWDYTTAAPGSYAFLYQCQSGFQFAVINTTTNTASGIPCGASFTVTPSKNSIVILPLLSGSSAVSVPFSVLFVPTTGTQIQGNATMTVHPGSSSVAAASSTPAATTRPSSSIATPTRTAAAAVTRRIAPADLAVHITSDYIDQYGNGTVTFTISNIGGSSSGSYYFTAQLPTSSLSPYISAIQAPLSPGSHIENTLRFTQAQSGTFTVEVNATDRNQANNYAAQWMNAPVTYSQYQNGGYYQGVIPAVGY